MDRDIAAECNSKIQEWRELFAWELENIEQFQDGYGAGDGEWFKDVWIEDCYIGKTIYDKRGNQWEFTDNEVWKQLT